MFTWECVWDYSIEFHERRRMGLFRLRTAAWDFSKFIPSGPFNPPTRTVRRTHAASGAFCRANARRRILDSKGIARKVRRPKSRQIDNSWRTRLPTYVHARTHAPTHPPTYSCTRVPAASVHRDFALNAELDPAERKPSRANNDSDSNGVLQSWAPAATCACAFTRTLAHVRARLHSTQSSRISPLLPP